MMCLPFVAVATALAGRFASATTYTVSDFDAYNDDAYGSSPNVTFKSTDVIQPLFQVTSWNKSASGLAGGYIIMTPAVAEQNSGAMILRGDDLSLVYALIDLSAGSDANIQTVDGTPMLTLYDGSTGGTSEGYCYIYNSTLDLVYNFTTVALSVLADGHEFKMTTDNTAIVSAYVPKTADLTAVGGSTNDTLLDSCFEEVDFHNNTSVFTWCASDWFPINETLSTYSSSGSGGYGGTTGSNSSTSSGPGADYGASGDGNQTTGGAGGNAGAGGGMESGFDYAHINAISKVDGNYLVSLRLLAVVTYVDGKTGEPIWVLGGSENMFTDLSDGQATNFAYQHHARFRNDARTHLTMFDNHELSSSDGYYSRGLSLELDYDAMTAQMVAEYYNPQSLVVQAMGSVVLLDNDNVLVGWGMKPSITEHDSEGNVVAEFEYAPLSSGDEVYTYRVFWVPTSDWVANPTTSPDIALEDSIVYVSWNGATRVEKWAILDSAGNTLQTAARDGFETAIQVSNLTVSEIRAAAMTADGEVLGKTDLVEL